MVALTDDQRDKLTELSRSSSLSPTERQHLTALLNAHASEPKSLVDIAKEKFPEMVERSARLHEQRSNAMYSERTSR